MIYTELSASGLTKGHAFQAFTSWPDQLIRWWLVCQSRAWWWNGCSEADTQWCVSVWRCLRPTHSDVWVCDAVWGWHSDVWVCDAVWGRHRVMCECVTLSKSAWLYCLTIYLSFSLVLFWTSTHKQKHKELFTAIWDSAHTHTQTHTQSHTHTHTHTHIHVAELVAWAFRLCWSPDLKERLQSTRQSIKSSQHFPCFHNTCYHNEQCLVRSLHLPTNHLLK